MTEFLTLVPIIMKKTLLRIIDSMLKGLNGKKRFQSLFHSLYFISLRGLNFNNDDLHTNGEEKMLKRLASHYRHTEPVIFDVGANVGKYALSLIDIFGSQNYRLYCFEPLGGTFRMLKSN